MDAKGYRVEMVRVAWEGVGWIRAWMRLWQGSREWKGKWVLVQYTALMWSRRGLPLAFLGVLLILKARGVRLITTFHDVAPYPGRRMVDRIRRACQRWVVRRAYGWARASILPVPKDQVSWLPRPATKASFIPVGPNVPVITPLARSARNGNEPKTIAVFVVTDGGDISEEVSTISHAAKVAAQHIRQVRLVTLGRGSRESESAFRKALAGSSVEYQAFGILSAGEVSRVLSECDVSLFVRGRISPQRGSAIASIACGLPLVGYADGCPPGPLTEAGVLGVPWGDREALAEAVVKVLTNDHLWLELHQRSQRAYEKYFSWEAIAAHFVELLGHA
ncbi:MAG TPA: glycosyltransferase [Terriglobia bacterium]|nr:glycosyltransferase [Terriglobia bacterium]